MNLGSKGMSGRLLQYFTRHTTPDLQAALSAGGNRGPPGLPSDTAPPLTSRAAFGGSRACGDRDEGGGGGREGSAPQPPDVTPSLVTSRP